MISASADPEKLLKQLRALWRDAGTHDPAGVLRACAMTLVVVADERQDAGIIGETIAHLMHEHPSRAIVVRVRDCAEQVMESRVFAQCWMPFGRSQQICCEQVEIIASPNTLADVATVVRALIVPDLPQILYCPNEDLWRLPEFQAMLPASGKLIIDSGRTADPAGVIRFLAKIRPRVRYRADLAWSRLTPWREAVARIFEGSAGAHAREVKGIDIRHSGAEPPAAARYLAGWFSSVLGESAPVRLEPCEGSSYNGICRVSITTSERSATLEVAGQNTCEIRLNGEDGELALFPECGEEYALRQELAIAGHDPVFDAALKQAEEGAR